MNLVRRVANLEVRPAPPAVQAEPLPLETPADVVALIEEQANAVRADPLADPAEKARTLGFLSGVALRAMEAKDMAQRLEAVERVLKLRKEAAQGESWAQRKRRARGW